MPNPIIYRRILATLACLPIDSLNITSLISELTDAQIQGIIDGRLEQRVVEITNIGTNTYNKPSDLIFAFVVCIGAGGAGGSGRKGAASVNRTGGAGGASGGLARRWLYNNDIANTETITIGTGGIGGASITIDSTNGLPGSAGTSTSFGTLVIAPGGNGGFGGAQASAVAGGTAVNISTGYTPSQFPLSIGNTAGGVGSNAGSTDALATGFNILLGNNGGGGAGLGGSNSPQKGANGSRSYDRTGTLSALNVGGIAGGGDGNNGFDNISLQLHIDYVSGIPLNTIGFGTSGSAGGSVYLTSTDAGDGGNGGLYGTGGPGGGASTNTISGGNSGTGGNGAQGCCIIFEYYV